MTKSFAVHGGEVPDELLQAVQGKFEVARRSGHGSDDMAAVYTAFLPAG